MVFWRNRWQRKPAGSKYLYTQEIIATAVPQDCHRCVIALALRRATGYEWSVSESDGRIDTYYGRKPVWTFPREIRDVIWRFDHGGEISPHTFRVPARFAAERWRGMGTDAPEVA